MLVNHVIPKYLVGCVLALRSSPEITSLQPEICQLMIRQDRACSKPSDRWACRKPRVGIAANLLCQQRNGLQPNATAQAAASRALCGINHAQQHCAAVQPYASMTGADRPEAPGVRAAVPTGCPTSPLGRAWRQDFDGRTSVCLTARSTGCKPW